MCLELVNTEGIQELKKHEKDALLYLQKQIPGPGYLIPALMVGKRVDNREMDAVMILSDMIVLVELKHYRDPKIEVPGLNTKIRRYKPGGLVEYWTNPCHNLAYSAKVLSKLFRPRVRTVGMLIFTHERLEELIVQGQPVVKNQGELLYPNEQEVNDYALLNGVAVCQLPAVSNAIEEFRQELARQYTIIQLREKELEKLKNVVLGKMTPLPPDIRWLINTYIVDKRKTAVEDNYQLWLGHEKATDLPVWIKEYRRGIITQNPDKDARLLLQGATALSKWDKHPNFPTYQGYYEKDDHIYVIFRREPGEFLRKYMEIYQPTMPEKLKILSDLLDGLSHIHSHKEGDRIALYRDLRPESVFITTKGRAQLFNFDCSRIPSRKTALEQAKDRAHRWWHYASFELQNASAPEQIGTPTDIYSWGVVAYEMLTSRLPYTDLAKVRYGKFRILTRSDLPLPEQFLNSIKQSLSLEPEKRPVLDQLRLVIQEAINTYKQHS